MSARWMVAVALSLVTMPAAAQRTDVQRIDSVITAYASLGRFSGSVLVARGSRVIISRGYGQAVREWSVAATSDTRYDIGSITKRFTAAAMLRLEQDGKIHLSDSVARYLPGYRGPVTLHQLLTHTAGIPSLERLGDGLDDIVPGLTPIARDSLLGFFIHRPTLFLPGERFRYSNSRSEA